MDLTGRSAGAVAGKFAYGALFVLAWPALLAVWAQRLDRLGAVPWPAPSALVWAAGLATGLALMAAAMHALWRHGGGLPMNAFPPDRLVERSVFGVFNHPIYVGFCLAAFSLASLAGSPAGFWLVAPVASCAAAALVCGYEGPALAARFGSRPAAPVLGLPFADEARAPAWRRAAAVILAWGPWASVFILAQQARAAASAGSSTFAVAIPWPDNAAGWAALALTALCPLAIRTAGALRKFIIGVWVASCAGLFVMTAAPDWDGAAAFAAGWTLTATVLYAQRLAGFRLARLLAGAVVAAEALFLAGLPLLAAGSGAVIAGLALHVHSLARCSVGLSERLANSWRSWRFGPIRVMSHAPWTGFAAFFGTLGTAALIGPGAAGSMLFVILAGLAAALAFGLALEGRRLSRPFGYFGFLFGGLAALAVITVRSPGFGASLAASIAAAAPFAQAIGRGRCLVQGCCHGRESSGSLAIRVHNPMSRVACLANLKGAPIHPTQVYSAVANLAIGAVLLRLWAGHAPAALICGLYLVFTALARFVEEGFRGEPQTPTARGLAVYQWLCVGLLLAGILVTMAPSAPVSAALALDGTELAVATGAALLSVVLMSADWPDSGWPLSRLAPAREPDDPSGGNPASRPTKRRRNMGAAEGARSSNLYPSSGDIL